MSGIDSPADAEVKKRKCILVLDDDKDTCQMMALLLQSFGYRATITMTVAEAQSAIKKDVFSLLILDGMGLELWEMVRAKGYG